MTAMPLQTLWVWKEMWVCRSPQFATSHLLEQIGVVTGFLKTVLRDDNSEPNTAL